ncbi:hypothetical protein [Bdellovibrio sp. HCB337]|uniref:hypothetical protein n=1 Tax=Bdellovibrio sp. HCB337 TaxID=3394358 RepID=UPI0039A4DF33
MIKVILAVIALSSFAFAETKEKAKDRFPAATAIATVKATSLEGAMKKFSANKAVTALIRAERAKYKDCGGSLGKFDAKSAMQTYTGKGGVADHYVAHLVPIYGGCGGSGMIEEAHMLGKVGVRINVELEDEEYYFFGFVKVRDITPGEKDQSSGLSNN